MDVRDFITADAEELAGDLMEWLTPGLPRGRT
jgi:hypothetical protein